MKMYIHLHHTQLEVFSCFESKCTHLTWNSKVFLELIICLMIKRIKLITDLSPSVYSVSNSLSTF